MSRSRPLKQNCELQEVAKLFRAENTLYKFEPPFTKTNSSLFSPPQKNIPHESFAHERFAHLRTSSRLSRWRTLSIGPMSHRSGVPLECRLLIHNHYPMKRSEKIQMANGMVYSSRSKDATFGAPGIATNGARTTLRRGAPGRTTNGARTHLST